MLSLIQLLDDEKCFDVVRQLRWPDGITCPHCHALHVIKQGRDDTQHARQRYRCLNCQRKFDDLTGTVFAGHHQPLRQWVAFLVRAAPMTTLDRCLYLMGLNLSNRQIAHELGLNEDDAHNMARTLRQGVVDASTTPTLAGTVEIDEVYLVAGHKGQSDLVKKNVVLDADDA